MNRVWLLLIGIGIALFVAMSGFAYASSKNMNDCVSCHEAETDAWKQSDHAKAMLEPSSTSIVADLSQSYSDQYGNQFSIEQKEGDFYALVKEGKEKQRYKIEKTFGHFPLQQYLVATEGGRLQVLPYSWDARAESEGGQKWFHVYEDILDTIDISSRYHWKQPLQNWNGMCADCHSSELKREFNTEANQFDTSWSEINVGCLSCHSVHDENMKSAVKLTGSWQRLPEDKVAKWVGDKRDEGTIETCFSCHSLREPLTDGFSAQGEFLDKHSPNLLEQPFYYPDGQIKDEVYVYGSFMQSKMAQADVTCLDCHDSHTMKVKVEGDALCLSCHSPDEYFSKDHNKHSGGSDSTQCVDCHMPETTYMGVDARRDHSFSIPNPPLSHLYQSPDTCLSCHSDQDTNWSMQRFTDLYGEVPPRSDSDHTFSLARSGQLEQRNKIWSVVNDKHFPVIKRASALTLLPSYYSQLSGVQLAEYFESEHDLIRLAAAKVSILIEGTEKERYVAPLLSDKRKAIRVEAAKQLLGIQLSPQWSSAFSSAYEELYSVNQLSTWRAEGLLNLAELTLMNSDVKKAEQLYLFAIERAPYFDASYINLAELYRALSNLKQERDTYDQAIKNGVSTHNFHFSLGLYYVRQGELEESVVMLDKAMKGDKNNSQYAFVRLLALKKLGNENEFQRSLSEAKKRFPSNQSIRSLR
ncbi:hypothetical protein L4C54_02295 [Vibrio lamellibrachiae]|uniref:multiheme c-type cytochrome n=1 Tax=Vibrio lamellibrachiae TaxID=2910253 RepID=UPI003D0BA04F